LIDQLVADIISVLYWVTDIDRSTCGGSGVNFWKLHSYPFLIETYV